MMRTLILCVLILAMAIGLSSGLWFFRPRPEEKVQQELLPSVEVVVARSLDVPMTIASQGVVEARTLTNAAAEVAGKVIAVAPAMEAGGRFEEGDVLLRIDQSDYESAVARARSALASAALELQVEEAKAEQSVRDWKKLGRREEPSPLVQREPQLASARAAYAAAEAEVAKRERDLERTVLRAPYRGRVLRTHTDLASFVGVGAPLADFYESTALEVRLPISLPDLEFLDLTSQGTVVELSTSTGHRWEAEIVRQESEIDRRSRSLHLIAAVRQRSSSEEDDALMVPGLFVRASIKGRALTDVFRLPRRALQEEDTIIVVENGDTLSRREVTVVRREIETVIVGDGLREGDRVCVSFLPVFQPGMAVNVVGESVTQKK